MKTFSTKRLSLLGLVVLAASAVTAAIMPSKSKSDQKFDVFNGTFDANQTDDNNNTCRARAFDPVNAWSCQATAGSGTTNVGDGSVSQQTTADVAG